MTKAEPVRSEPPYDEPVRSEPPYDEPVRSEPPYDEPVRSEPWYDEPVRSEPPYDESVRSEPWCDEPVRPEPPYVEEDPRNAIQWELTSPHGMAARWIRSLPEPPSHVVDELANLVFETARGLDPTRVAAENHAKKMEFLAMKLASVWPNLNGAIRAVPYGTVRRTGPLESPQFHVLVYHQESSQPCWFGPFARAIDAVMVYCGEWLPHPDATYEPYSQCFPEQGKSE